MSTLPAAALRLEPVSLAQRIEALDVLRGAALFGILVVNIGGFNTPLAAWFNPSLLFNDPLNRTVRDLITLFFTYKFISIFSFLFGLGFAIQMSRAAQKGISPAALISAALPCCSPSASPTGCCCGPAIFSPPTP